MRKILRGDCPQALNEKGAEWTERYGASGYWPTYKKRNLRDILLDEGLRDQTLKHCSYCDTIPFYPPGEETIDHFRPKATYPHLAYAWENLFYCCPFCQRKKYEEALIKPDDADYEFARYFQWEFATGRLLPNEVATSEDQYRAERTIELLRLNLKHAESRVFLRESLETRPLSLDRHPYRDFIEMYFG